MKTMAPVSMSESRWQNTLGCLAALTLLTLGTAAPAEQRSGMGAMVEARLTDENLAFQQVFGSSEVSSIVFVLQAQGHRVDDFELAPRFQDTENPFADAAPVTKYTVWCEYSYWVGNWDVRAALFEDGFGMTVAALTLHFEDGRNLPLPLSLWASGLIDTNHLVGWTPELASGFSGSTDGPTGNQFDSFKDADEAAPALCEPTNIARVELHENSRGVRFEGDTAWTPFSTMTTVLLFR